MHNSESLRTKSMSGMLMLTDPDKHGYEESLPDSL